MRPHSQPADFPPAVQTLFRTLAADFGPCRWQSPIPKPQVPQLTVTSYQITELDINYLKNRVKFRVKELDKPVSAWLEQMPPGMDRDWLVDFTVQTKRVRAGGGAEYYVVAPGTLIQTIARSAYSAALEVQQKQHNQGTIPMPDMSTFFDSSEFMNPDLLGGQMRTVVMTGRVEPFKFNNDDGTESKGIRLWVTTEQGHAIPDPLKVTPRRYGVISGTYGPNTDLWVGQKLIVKPDEFQGHRYVEIVGAPPGAAFAAPAAQYPAAVSVFDVPPQNAPQLTAADANNLAASVAAAVTAPPSAPPAAAPGATETVHDIKEDDIPW